MAGAYLRPSQTTMMEVFYENSRYLAYLDCSELTIKTPKRR